MFKDYSYLIGLCAKKKKKKKKKTLKKQHKKYEYEFDSLTSKHKITQNKLAYNIKINLSIKQYSHWRHFYA